MEFSAKIKNLKCFGEDYQGFQNFFPINLIIGRNNVGKSTLLDLIEAVSADGSHEFQRDQWRNDSEPKILLQAPLTEGEVKEAFPENVSGGTIRAANHWIFGQRYVGRVFRWFLPYKGDPWVDESEIDDYWKISELSDSFRYLQRLAETKKNPIADFTFRRITAERDIVPEEDQPGNLEVSSSGRGVTNVVQNFLNKANLNSAVVERDFLYDLNRIMQPDAFFLGIVCQQYRDLTWEIWLVEENKGRISLSNSGSGLKTIFLLLTFIHLVPRVEKKELSQTIFGIEEPENNLHPALLRRLLSFISSVAKKKGCMFFITSHSNVAIDLFNTDSDAQIVHVTHDGNTATARQVRTYVDSQGVLDDLDVRASDILQANSIVWIEGPSDRIYLNAWIRLLSGGSLREGVHYQCVFYGGRLLSHLSAESPDEDDSSINILRINRKAALLVDSDKKTKRSRLNNTKKRMIKEVQEIGGYTWVTQGREIENYVPSSVFARILDTTVSDEFEIYESVFDQLDRIQTGMGEYYRQRKPLLAERVVPLLDLELVQATLDVAERTSELIDKIKAWNKLR